MLCSRAILCFAVVSWVFADSSNLRGQSANYVNFESHQTRPVCLSPDGTRLFAVNTPDGRLSVFDVSNPVNPAPVLIREIPVGVEPVSVNAVSNDEAWVVNEVSDSVSVVSVPNGAVVATLPCKDEPADVVFANGEAFVSCSRNNLVRVFNLNTLSEITTIPLQGLNPRSLAVSTNGANVYAAFTLSGNRTTLLPSEIAPAQPPPTNQSLPGPPRVGLIVNSDDSRLSPQLNQPDNDVVEIATDTLSQARYFRGIGTVNFGLAVNPVSNDVWVANTEARNLTRFEPNLKGHAVDNRVTRIITAGAGAVTSFDLNPGVDYSLLPNNLARATALAQPVGMAFEPDGNALWVASFGSDRLAKINPANGSIISRIETGPTTGVAVDSRNKRGPRGLAYQAVNHRLYVLNRISNSISTISTTSEQVVSEIPVGSYDPTPPTIRQGRGFLYDARLSGNGTQSCASCHVDGDRDELAWDLGDPGGSMQTVNSAGQPFSMHPMKGPMITQTLRGLSGINPQHWRGDRATFLAFNPAFASLLGGSQLSTADMTAFRDFINTIVFEPNPNQNLNRTMPSVFPPGDPDAGDPNAGRNTYLNEPYSSVFRCSTCHSLPTGTNGLIISAAMLQNTQAMKTPQLRNVYQKVHFVRSSIATSLSGFGLTHDGGEAGFIAFLSQPVFGTFANDTTRKRNLSAFMQCFDTGTAPSVGYTRTVNATTLAGSAADWSLLEAQVMAGNSDLVVRLLENGARTGFLYRSATNDYLSDDFETGSLTRSALESKIAGGGIATIMGTPRNSGRRLSIDRNENAILDADEPLPLLNLSLAGGTPELAWPIAESALVLEYSNSLNPASWQTVTTPRDSAGAFVNVLDPTTDTRRFYRLRKP